MLLSHVKSFLEEDLSVFPNGFLTSIAVQLAALLADKVFGTLLVHDKTNLLVCWALVAKFCVEETYLSIDRSACPKDYLDDYDYVTYCIQTFRAKNTLTKGCWTKKELLVLSKINWDLATFVHKHCEPINH